ncbi:alpha/beta fold hydrolase [Nocardia sp. NPDC088792]|uniref:alpha/beta fold hydrolase n=1 Tax=Nocardia sp. NPDC088792 TaxID=3364332 RepID=UPI00382291EC
MPKIGRFTSDQAKETFLRRYDGAAAEWPIPSTRTVVETSYGTTPVRKSGTGEGTPIVLLPGMPGNGQIWLRFIADLARDRVVYTPDVMGWPGRCEQTAPLRDGLDVAKWLVEVLDGLGLERVHLAGNSVGSWISIMTAATYPERLASLTMFEPGGGTFAKPRWSLLIKFLAAGLRPTPDRMRKFNKWLNPSIELSDEEFEMVMACLKFRPGMPWEKPLTDEQLATITAPMLVLFGAETVANDLAVVPDKIRKHIPAVDIEIYPGIGHDVLWANPDQVIPRFLNFIAAHDQVLA